MAPFAVALVGILVILATLVDAFEVVLLPRPARRTFRLNRYFFLRTWAIWSRLAARLPIGPRRENFVGVYGPLSMVLLFTLWAACLIVGFGVLQWALQFALGGESPQSLGHELIMSGDAFFTLGYGDIIPRRAFARLLIIFEAGTGFGFIALTVSYLPVLYQHFASRDVQLIELAARAGSPPTGIGLLRWHVAKGDPRQTDEWLRDWEHWAGELIESHSTYPMLAFYRSQHDGHSWLASIAVVLDACTLVIAGVDSGRLLQAAATFSAARRVLDEISRSLGVASVPWEEVRTLDLEVFAEFSRVLSSIPDWRYGRDTADLVTRLRHAYEPQLGGLSTYLLLPLPAWGDTRSSDAGALVKHQIIKDLVGSKAPEN